METPLKALKACLSQHCSTLCQEFYFPWHGCCKSEHEDRALPCKEERLPWQYRVLGRWLHCPFKVAIPPLRALVEATHMDESHGSCAATGHGREARVIPDPGIHLAEQCPHSPPPRKHVRERRRTHALTVRSRAEAWNQRLGVAG